MNHWGQKMVTRAEVVDFLKAQGRDDYYLQVEMVVFDGMTAEDFAYRVGWAKVLGIFKRIWE